jgi:transketolase
LENGAYIVKDSKQKPDLLLIATGSEVSLSLKAAEQLEAEGKNVRVISFPSWEIFEQQSDEYKKQIFPAEIKSRISVEMGVGMGWQKYVGDSGETISIERFGASAPDSVLYEKYGFTVENVAATAKRVLNKKP